MKVDRVALKEAQTREAMIINDERKEVPAAHSESFAKTNIRLNSWERNPTSPPSSNRISSISTELTSTQRARSQNVNRRIKERPHQTLLMSNNILSVDKVTVACSTNNKFVIMNKASVGIYGSMSGAAE